MSAYSSVCVDFSNLSKYQTAVWLTLKAHIQQNSGTEQLYICKYCQPFLNKNTMPARCVFNGLFTEPVPDELKALDALSKQLIQQAKVFRQSCGWVHILVKSHLIMPSKHVEVPCCFCPYH